MSRIELLEPRAAYALWAASYPPRAHNPVMRVEERAMLGLMPTDLYGQSVLDAGCGSGRYMLHALDRGAGPVTGVDLSVEMLERAGRELDARRRAAFLPLLQRIHRSNSQVFMTCTEENWPQELARKAQRWHVAAGKITAQ